MPVIKDDWGKKNCAKCANCTGSIGWTEYTCGRKDCEYKPRKKGFYVPQIDGESIKCDYCGKDTGKKAFWILIDAREFNGDDPDKYQIQNLTACENCFNEHYGRFILNTAWTHVKKIKDQPHHHATIEEAKE